MGEHDPDGRLDPAWQRVLADLASALSAERTANERLRKAIQTATDFDQVTGPTAATTAIVAILTAALSPSTDDTPTRCEANADGKCRPDYHNGICLDCGEPSTYDTATCPPHDFDLLRQCHRCGLGMVRPSTDDTAGPIVWLECRSCGTKADLVAVDGAVDTSAIGPWYFTSETKWLCPTCAPSTEGATDE